MPSYMSYLRQMAVLDADDNEIESWITVRGNHIPIMKGQSKEDAVKSFIEKKGGSGGRINTNIDPNREKAGKTKYDPSDDFATQLYKNKKGKGDYTIAHKDKSGNTTVIAEVSHKDVNSGESDYDKEYHKVRSELKEAFSDYPKFNIKDNFAVSENDYKRVVAEKYKDGVIGVTTETAEGLLLNHADFKDWDSAAKYAEKERAQHKINVGGSGEKKSGGEESDGPKNILGEWFVKTDVSWKELRKGLEEGKTIGEMIGNWDDDIVYRVAGELAKVTGEEHHDLYDKSEDNRRRGGSKKTKKKEPAIVREGGVNWVDAKKWNDPRSDPWYALYN